LLVLAGKASFSKEFPSEFHRGGGGYMIFARKNKIHEHGARRPHRRSALLQIGEIAKWDTLQSHWSTSRSHVREEGTGIRPDYLVNRAN